MRRDENKHNISYYCALENVRSIKKLFFSKTFFLLYDVDTFWSFDWIQY